MSHYMEINKFSYLIKTTYKRTPDGLKTHTKGKSFKLMRANIHGHLCDLIVGKDLFKKFPNYKL